MRGSPFTSLRVTIRVFAKAVTLALLCNFVLLATGIDPVVALAKINTWALFGQPGADRMTFPNAYVRGQLPLEALLAQHEISYKPKAPNEFRVIVLGDSGQWGYGLRPDERFAGQLAARGLQINGKRLVTYNLAYPGGYAPREAMILDAATKFYPDLVIWFVTANELESGANGLNSDNQTFFRLDQRHVDQVITVYHQEWLGNLLPPTPLWQQFSAIRTQDVIPVWLDSLMFPLFADRLNQHGTYPAASRVKNIPIPEKAEIDDGFKPLAEMPNESWQFLLVGQQIAEKAGARLLIINEPILIGEGTNSDINYNSLYSRAAYDRYRVLLAAFANEHHLWYADLWNAIPAENFTNTPLHADADGWKIVVDAVTGLLPQLQPLTLAQCLHSPASFTRLRDPSAVYHSSPFRYTIVTNFSLRYRNTFENRAINLQADQAALCGDADGLGTVAGAEFTHDRADVKFDGAFGDRQCGGNFLVDLALR